MSANYFLQDCDSYNMNAKKKDKKKSKKAKKKEKKEEAIQIATRQSEIENHYRQTLSFAEFEGGFDGLLNNDDDSDDQIGMNPVDAEEEEINQIGKVNLESGREKADALMRHSIIKAMDNLQLENFELYDLDFMEGQKWITLAKIYLKDNLIQNIVILNNFQSLKVIDAENCQIELVNLRLPILQQLNLSGNHINVWPILKGCKRLEYLNINNNKIHTVIPNEEEVDYFDTLRTLDLGQNEITIENEDKLDEFIMKIKQFGQLRDLIFEENPFLHPDMEVNFGGKDPRISITEKITSIETLDGMKILDYIKKVTDDQYEKEAIENKLKDQEELGIESHEVEVQDEEEKGMDEQQEAQPQEKAEKKFVPPVTKQEKTKKIPSLEKLLSHLESANRNSPDALKHLKNLASDVDKVIEPTKGIIQIDSKFAPGKSTEDIQEEIQTFMQNAQLLIDNHQELQGIMLSILAKLSIVKFQNFGIQCFNTLTDLMKSGRDMELQIIEVIEMQVINKLQGEDPTAIPVTLLIGLHALIDDCGIPKILRGMYDTVLGTWLEKYSEKLEKCYKQSGTNFGDHEHYDAIISLVAVSVRDEGCIEKVMDKSLNDEIVKILKFSDWTKIRYIPCLDMVAAMANAEEEAANEFMESHVHQELLKEVGSSMNIYKQHKSLFDEFSKETVEQQLLKYNTLASEIRLLGGLLQSNLDYREQILSTSVPLSIIEVIGEKKTDPILLTACCTFAYDLLECNNIRLFQEDMEKYSVKMNNLVYMIPYLGFNMYPQLIEMSRRYQNAINYAQKVTDSGSPVIDGDTANIKEELDETIDPEAKEAERKEQIKTSMQHLNDQIVCDLFISIIRLIEFICREASCNTQNDLFYEISQNLNENDDTPREQALFNCLEIPNDEVKLAAVKCLFVISIEDIDSSEISQITNVMSTCKNIGAGNTELVLSTIYWICTKFVIGDPEQIEQPKIFQEKYGEKTVNEALDILEANLKRITSGDDDEEKYALSLSILNFLKASTLAPMMQKYLLNKSEKFKSILYYEDLYSSETVKTVPIDIENTIIGKEMNSLIDCISGNNTIQPYCDVSLRIIIRMADVLMNRQECEVYEISDKPDVVDELYEYQLKMYQRKKDKELDFWIDKPARFYEMLEEQEDGDKYIHELRIQHQNFTSSNGVALLKMFLTSKYPINEEYMHQLINKQFDERAQQKEDGFIKDLENNQSIKIQKFENKYMVDEYSIRRIMLDKQLKKQGASAIKEISPNDEKDDEQNQMMNANCKKTSIYQYMQMLQFEKLGKNYLDTLVEGDDTAAKNDMEQKLNARKREEEAKERENAGGGQGSLKDQRGDGFLNKPIRNLTVAAYLRCLYAAIEYAPTVDLRLNAIQNIRDPLMFRTITQLCDSTDWDEEAGIGAKYLRVMRHILKLPLDKGAETTDMLMHYEMISSVCQKALIKIIDKLNKDIELTRKDQICQYELSLTMFTVLVQTQNFQFYDKTIEQQNKINEYIITNFAKKKKKMDKKFFENALKPKESDQWKQRCLLLNKQYGKELSEQQFHVEIPVIHLKRTCQQKIVEFMVLKLFTKQSIFSLIDMLFKDMTEDAKIFNPDEESNEDEEAVDEEEKKEDEDEDEYIDVQRSSHDIEQYIDVKGCLTIERVKDIVGEIMCSCQKKMRYCILENIMKGVIFEKKKLRESFMQEILTSADEAQFRIELQKYINDPYTDMLICPPTPEQLSDINYKHPVERIIEYVKCDMQDKILEDQYLKVENQKDTDNGWYIRHFVITNKGIQILKDIPEDRDCDNDPPCDDQEFCPRGPYHDTIIKFPDIKSIVYFPQLLQKLVIFYQINEREQLWQLTLNVPTFTKAAKIYNNILDIQKISEFEESKIVKEAMSKDKEQKLKRLDAYQKSYVDMFVQAELRDLINEISPMSKESARQLKLIYGTYLKVDKNIVGDEFFEKHIATSTSEKEGIKKLDQGANTSPFIDERECVMDDNIIIMITFSHVIFLKEKWENWKLIRTPQQLNKWRQEQLRILEVELRQEEEAKEAKKEEPKKKGIDEYQLEQEEKCMKFRKSLFKVVTVLQIEDITRLEVHRGADPTIELMCNEQEQDPITKKPHPDGKMFYHKAKVLFPGDMERQMFVSRLIGIQKGEIEDKIVEEEEADEEDSDEQDAESSLESVIEGYPYD